MPQLICPSPRLTPSPTLLAPPRGRSPSPARAPMCGAVNPVHDNAIPSWRLPSVQCVCSLVESLLPMQRNESFNRREPQSLQSWTDAGAGGDRLHPSGGLRRGQSRTLHAPSENRDLTKHNPRAQCQRGFAAVGVVRGSHRRSKGQHRSWATRETRRLWGRWAGCWPPNRTNALPFNRVFQRARRRESCPCVPRSRVPARLSEYHISISQLLSARRSFSLGSHVTPPFL